MVSSQLASDSDTLLELSSILTDTRLNKDVIFAESGLPCEHPLNLNQLSSFLAAGSLLDDAHYVLILDDVQTNIRPFQSYKNLPAQPGTPVLPPNAHSLCPFTVDGRTFSDQLQHEGNSMVQFHDMYGTDRTGSIQAIWVLPLVLQLRTFILICPHTPLSDVEFWRTPYAHYKLLKTRIYDATPSPYLIVLEPKDIVAHVTTL